MLSLGRYRHYKGGIYNVLGEATHTETEEILVVYTSVETSRMFVRPLAMFLEMVQTPDGLVPRFKPL